MSKLVEHAKRELEIAGLFDADSDYEGYIAESVLELIKTFAAQGHSGGSADLTRLYFYALSDFVNLTKLTFEDDFHLYYT